MSGPAQQELPASGGATMLLCAMKQPAVYGTVRLLLAGVAMAAFGQEQRTAPLYIRIVIVIAIDGVSLFPVLMCSPASLH